jgi:hypothetical protein
MLPCRPTPGWPPHGPPHWCPHIPHAHKGTVRSNGVTVQRLQAVEPTPDRELQCMGSCFDERPMESAASSRCTCCTRPKKARTTATALHRTFITVRRLAAAVLGCMSAGAACRVTLCMNQLQAVWARDDCTGSAAAVPAAGEVLPASNMAAAPRPCAGKPQRGTLRPPHLTP